MKTLMHICCAPCANMPIDSLRDEGIYVEGLWYNPNIHPYTEYCQRKDTLVNYAQTIDMPLTVVDEYGLRPFVQAVCGNIENRCGYCYKSRMEETARFASENRFDNFTTSLLVSPYQNHEGICSSAKAMSEKYKIDFLYRDFRPLFRAGQDRARQLGMYMQKYCGCIFSEENRYLNQKKKKKKKQAG